jgi:hypothetical protein
MTERTPGLLNVARLAALSIVNFGRLASSGKVSLRRDRLWSEYEVERGGPFAIFRETVSSAGSDNRPTVLVVGFRLRFIGSARVPHWLFQRACILTTPFWSGFRGFRVKLWMVNPETRDYLGIYDWYGERDARVYADALSVILRAVSTRGSVWYEVAEGDFEAYLAARRR